MIIAASLVPAGNPPGHYSAIGGGFRYRGVFRQLRTGCRMLRQPFLPGVTHKIFTVSFALPRINSRSAASRDCSIAQPREETSALC
jgi:hypothetical protein